jgi:hypothetical protein
MDEVPRRIDSATDRVSAAIMLDTRTGRPCARCKGLTCRFGRGAQPVCPCVDREDRAGSAVLQTHVADRGAIGQRHLGHARSVELHEGACDAMMAQPLGDGQHQIGCGAPFGLRAGESYAHDFGDEHVHRTAEHRWPRCLPPPAEDAEPIDHRGVGIGPDQRVGEGCAILGEHHPDQVLQVDLVAESGSRGTTLSLRKVLYPQRRN